MLNKAIMQDVPIKFWKSLFKLLPSFLRLIELILDLILYKEISHLFFKSLLFMVWEEKFDLLRRLRIVNPFFRCQLLGSLRLSLWFWWSSNSWKSLFLLIYSHPFFIAHIKEWLFLMSKFLGKTFVQAIIDAFLHINLSWNKVIPTNWLMWKSYNVRNVNFDLKFVSLRKNAL